MIKFPLLRKKNNDVEINNTTNIIKISIPLIHDKCNTDLSDDTTVISYGSNDTDSLTSSSDHSVDRSNSLDTPSEHTISNEAADPKKKNVRFHETTKNNDGKKQQQNKKRELISFDEKKSSSKTWYSVNDIKKFKKYQKDYARYLITIHPNDMDTMINAYDETSCTEQQNQKLICLRGMEKFIQRPSSADNNSNERIIISSSSARRKVLYEAVLSIQLQKQQQIQPTNNDNENNNSCCCTNDLLMNYYDVLIRTACIPITIPSIQYAYDIAQKDSYIAINHNNPVNNLVVI